MYKKLLCFLFLGILYIFYVYSIEESFFSSKVYTNAPRCSIL